MDKKVNAIQTTGSDLVKKADCNTKIEDIKKKVPNHDKYITKISFDKHTGAIFDERLKQAKLATIKYLNSVEQRAIRNEKKIEKLQIFDLKLFPW